MNVWQWTLTKEAIASCFVRDVLDMRESSEADFFWLGYTPCRTVLLVGMVVAIQAYDTRAIYTIDDGTAVIDCVLRHPRAAHHSPKKQRPDKALPHTIEPPPPVTEVGYPVRVVGRVVRHYESKQIYADSIDPCPSSLDEIAHLEHVIQLHKTKYSLTVPFVPPPKPVSHAPPPDSSTSCQDTDVGVFSNASISPHPGPTNVSYSLPTPPAPTPLQNRNRPPPIHATYHAHAHIPSSPTASSIASSTPSSPCEQHSPQRKPKLRHPSRLHTRDLTANTFRLYVKHYMDNAPPPSAVPSWSSSSTNVTTPTKRARYSHIESERDEATPRPPSRTEPCEIDDPEGPTLGFTLSHLRRVPELSLLATRVVRAETRKRDKAERDKTHESQHSFSVSTPTMPSKLGLRGSAMDLRKRMKRLFSWAVIKLHEEGSIVLWDGEARPLPVPPPPQLSVEDTNTMWHGGTVGSVCFDTSSIYTRGSASELYNLSASASLYSQYHTPRGRGGERTVSASGVVVDSSADPAEVSDPSVDEEAYVPLNPRFLARYVKEATSVLQRRRGRGRRGRGSGGGTAVTAEEVLAYMKRTDGRWARVGLWAVEEALAVG